MPAAARTCAVLALDDTTAVRSPRRADGPHEPDRALEHRHPALGEQAQDQCVLLRCSDRARSGCPRDRRACPRAGRCPERRGTPACRRAAAGRRRTARSRRPRRGGRARPSRRPGVGGTRRTSPSRPAGGRWPCRSARRRGRTGTPSRFREAWAPVLRGRRDEVTVLDTRSTRRREPFPRHRSRPSPDERTLDDDLDAVRPSAGQTGPMPDPTTADDVIARLGLKPHPEGGWYAETWRHEPGPVGRPAGTAIYYLLAAGQRSHWHRVDATEIWHFYAGDPLELSISDTDAGPTRTLLLGPDLAGGPGAAGHRPRGCMAGGRAHGRLDPGGLHRLARVQLRRLRAGPTRLVTRELTILGRRCARRRRPGAGPGTGRSSWRTRRPPPRACPWPRPCRRRCRPRARGR